MTYSLTVYEFKPDRSAPSPIIRRKRANDLATLRRHAWKSVRKLGKVESQNWGERGGDFPHHYRQAVITLA